MVCSFTSKRHVNKIKKLYKKSPQDFEYLHENPDGSICAKIPVKWLKISNATRVISEEQRQAASDRFKELHSKGLLKRKDEEL